MSMNSCPVCFESLLDKKTASPDTCEHVFCVTCLTKWSKLSRYCPIDRKRYKKIVKLDSEESIQVKLRRGRKKRYLYDVTAFCEVCRDSDSSSTLLLCDSCDLGYHCKCLTPPLTSVPIGKWFCPTCKEVEKRLGLKKNGNKKTKNASKKNERRNKAHSSENAEVNKSTGGAGPSGTFENKRCTRLSSFEDPGPSGTYSRLPRRCTKLPHTYSSDIYMSDMSSDDIIVVEERRPHHGRQQSVFLKKRRYSSNLNNDGRQQGVFLKKRQYKKRRCSSYPSKDNDSQSQQKVKLRRGRKKHNFYNITPLCEVCLNTDSSNTLLLCDSCNLRYHCECLASPLDSVPFGKWFCPPCIKVQKRRELKKKAKRKTENATKTNQKNKACSSENAEANKSTGGAGPSETFEIKRCTSVSNFGDPGPSGTLSCLPRWCTKRPLSYSSDIYMSDILIDSITEVEEQRPHHGRQQGVFLKKRRCSSYPSKDNDSQNHQKEINMEGAQPSFFLKKSLHVMPEISILSPSKGKSSDVSSAIAIRESDASEILDKFQPSSCVANQKYDKGNYMDSSVLNSPSNTQVSYNEETHSTKYFQNWKSSESNKSQETASATRNSSYLFENEINNSISQASQSRLSTEYFNMRKKSTVEVHTILNNSRSSSAFITSSNEHDLNQCVELTKDDSKYSDSISNPLHNFEIRNSNYAMKAKLNLQNELKEIEQKKWKSWQPRSLKRSKLKTTKDILAVPEKYRSSINFSSAPSLKIPSLTNYTQKWKDKWLTNCTAVVGRLNGNTNCDDLQGSKLGNKMDSDSGLNVFQIPQTQDVSSNKEHQALMINFIPEMKKTDLQNSCTFHYHRNLLEAALRTDLKTLCARKDGSLYINWAESE